MYSDSDFLSLSFLAHRQLAWHDRPRCLTLSTVTRNKPNALTDLDQNGMRQGVASDEWATMDRTPPAHRTGPHHPEIHAAQGKPIVLPAAAGEPQGTLLALRVKESGKREGPSVRMGYGLRHRPTRKRADFRAVIHGEKNLTNRCTRESR